MDVPWWLPISLAALAATVATQGCLLLWVYFVRIPALQGQVDALQRQAHVQEWRLDRMDDALAGTEEVVEAAVDDITDLVRANQFVDRTRAEEPPADQRHVRYGRDSPA